MLYIHRLQELDGRDWERVRISAGVPRAPGEVCSRYSPLEAGLVPTLHFRKGCFVGNEVLSRAVASKAGARKRLVGVISIQVNPRGRDTGRWTRWSRC